MKFDIPNDNNYDEIWNSLPPEPIYTVGVKYKFKYLGHYLSLLEETKEIQVYDLYFYEGSKFTNSKFIARYGNKESDYLEADNLEGLDNKELKKSPVGEAYRRYKKRKICKGYTHTL